MLTWPVPAFATWALAWALYIGSLKAGLGDAVGFLIALSLTAVLAWAGQTPWRRVFMFVGFPLSLALSGSAASLPSWVWLLPLTVLLALYPLGAWGDAPLFPTPFNALYGLAKAAPLADGSVVVDAGCGLGAGLIALRHQYPRARVVGWEWSWPLALLCGLRCRWLPGNIDVRRVDIWSADWAGADLVYLFQRPESMPRAMDKALTELKPGAWMASLEFEVTGLKPQARLETVPGKPVWLYRAPFKRR